MTGARAVRPCRVPDACATPWYSPAVSQSRSHRQKRGWPRAPCGRTSDRAVTCTPVEQLWARVLLRTAHHYCGPLDDRGSLRRGIVQVADENCLGGAHDDTGRLEPDIQPMRAEVALLGRMVVGIDEDRIEATCSDARFAANAKRFGEIDAIGPLEHRRGRAGADARCVGALIATRHLKRAAPLRKSAGVDGLHVGPCDAQRDLVLRLARRGARMAPNALRRSMTLIHFAGGLESGRPDACAASPVAPVIYPRRGP